MIKKITKTIQNKLNKPKQIEIFDKAFLLSKEYENLMSKHLPFPGTHDNHEAQNNTRNYEYRHHEVNHKLGIFRWRGIQKHKDLILGAITKSDVKVVDLGGAASPLGFDSTIVDFLPNDIWGRKVPYKYINDYPDKIDIVFTSHTLEHIENLEEVVSQVHGKLIDEGKFFVHIPSFYCERWRVGIHSNKTYNDHVWTFGLKDTPVPDGLNKYVEIDTLLSKYFDLKIVEYCGDDSIFIYGVKK